MTTRKIFKTGNRLAVSLPKEALSQLGLAEGSMLTVAFNPDTKQIILKPVTLPAVDGVDAEFSQQLDQFVEQYRPALNALAK